eukprot:359159-Chlamydomonas_euryale.AAC.19
MPTSTRCVAEAAAAAVPPPLLLALSFCLGGPPGRCPLPPLFDVPPSVRTSTRTAARRPTGLAATVVRLAAARRLLEAIILKWLLAEGPTTGEKVAAARERGRPGVWHATMATASALQPHLIGYPGPTPRPTKRLAGQPSIKTTQVNCVQQIDGMRLTSEEATQQHPLSPSHAFASRCSCV